MRPPPTVFAGALLALLTLAGCGQGTAPAPSGTTSATPAAPPAGEGFPVTVQAGNGPVVIPRRPERIVSLSPSATESLFAVGAGAQVVAVDDQSNYPAEAPKTDLSGFKPNLEAIVGKKPDLIVLSNDSGGIVAKLGALNVPVLLEPAAGELDEAYDQIADIGRATGHGAEAEKVVAGMKQRIEKVVADVPRTKKFTYYHELDNTPYSATSTTFIGQVYGLFGLTNIADKAPGASGGYPKLSAEFVAKADPDIVFLADVKCCGQSRETLAKRPGWSRLSAIKNDRVVVLDDDVASRWGPRVVDLAERIGGVVRKAATG